jgi:hypothetical protein
MASMSGFEAWCLGVRVEMEGFFVVGFFLAIFPGMERTFAAGILDAGTFPSNVDWRGILGTEVVSESDLSVWWVSWFSVTSSWDARDARRCIPVAVGVAPPISRTRCTFWYKPDGMAQADFSKIGFIMVAGLSAVRISTIVIGSPSRMSSTVSRASWVMDFRILL